jgi:hypothetical protein
MWNVTKEAIFGPRIQSDYFELYRGPTTERLAHGATL